MQMRTSVQHLFVQIILILGLSMSSVKAESFPIHQDIFVNDFADVIAPEAETRIRSALETLKADTGVEMTVLTIQSRSAFEAAGSLEAFSTGLFNHWGIGDANRNDGILLLVATEDRETRIELGSGYHQGYDVTAQDIISRWMVPAFRDLRWADGAEAGTREVIARIARRHAAQLPPEPVPSSPKGLLERAMEWIPWAAFAALGAFILFGRRLRDGFARFSRCPECGQRGLHRHRDLLDGTEESPKRHGRLTTTCRHCDYRTEKDYQISNRRSGSGGGGFGGGSSSGGGASGRW
ncbi:MAG: TPM domain-containing protein [Albidovulum sp.]